MRQWRGPSTLNWIIQLLQSVLPGWMVFCRWTFVEICLATRPSQTRVKHSQSGQEYNDQTADSLAFKCGLVRGSRTKSLNNDIVLCGSKHHARFFIYKQLRMPMNICGKCNGSGCIVRRLGCVENWKPYTPKVERMEPERSDDTFQKGISFFSGCHFRVKHVKFQGWYYPISLAQFFEGDGCRGEGAQKQTQGGRSKGRFKRGWNQLKMDRWRSWNFLKESPRSWFSPWPQVQWKVKMNVWMALSDWAYTQNLLLKHPLLAKILPANPWID